MVSLSLHNYRYNFAVSIMEHKEQDKEIGFMKFVVSNAGTMRRNVINLRIDNWDDYHFRTTFHGVYIDGKGERTALGTVKIAKSNMKKGERTKDSIPKEFEVIPQNYFSLWQSADSYQLVKDLEERLNENIFDALNDVAYDLNLFNHYEREPVMTDSLLRDVSRFMCENQFHRITRGEAKLTPYRFDYVVRHVDDIFSDVKLNFSVIPESFPPSNIHVLIGRNGTGKTRLIKHMISGICDEKSENESFLYPDENASEKSEHFESVLCVAFSPFDDFSELDKYRESSIKYNYIGIKKEYDSEGYEDGWGENSLLDDIKKQFLESFHNCMFNKTKSRDWDEVVKILESDPMFAGYDIGKYMYSQEYLDKIYYDNIKPIETLFENLSSGHKFVLSIITCCIDKLAEKTILFIDEPENHLHPPLVASMVRSVSQILRKRNGVAIISTHSPIVLQEVPKSCVWILNREGDFMQAHRPDIETFGANAGSLINEVFGYEVKSSGFQRMIKDAVEQKESYEEVLRQFEHQLGDEAKSMVRILFSQKRHGEL